MYRCLSAHQQRSHPVSGSGSREESQVECRVQVQTVRVRVPSEYTARVPSGGHLYRSCSCNSVNQTKTEKLKTGFLAFGPLASKTRTETEFDKPAGAKQNRFLLFRSETDPKPEQKTGIFGLIVKPEPKTMVW